MKPSRPFLISQFLTSLDSAMGSVLSTSSSVWRLSACAFPEFYALCVLEICHSRNETSSFIQKFCSPIFLNRLFLIPAHAHRVSLWYDCAAWCSLNVVGIMPFPLAFSLLPFKFSYIFFPPFTIIVIIITIIMETIQRSS